jgi:type I restriction enzyme S subunit
MTVTPSIALERIMAPRLGSVDPSAFPDEQFDLYSIPAFDQGEPEVLEGKAIGSAKQVVQPGDVLLSRIVPHIRRAWVVGNDRGRRIIASGEWIVFRGEHIDQRYLRQVLVSDPFHAEFMRTVSGVGGSLLRARPAYVAKIKIPLPPLPEQRRIADILDKADALRAKRRAALAEIDTLTQSIFLNMFGDPIINPRGFAVKNLIDCVDPARPISYGILKPGPNQEDGVKYVRVVDMRDGGISLSGIKKTTKAIAHSYRRSLLIEGDLLLSIRGHVGRLAIVPAELAGANITQDTARLAVSGIDTLFARECLRTPGFQHWMSKHTKGVAVRGINLGDVKIMPIIQPPGDQQIKFRRLVDRLEALRLAQTFSVAACDSLLGSLQSRAFSGQLLP